MRGDDPSDGPMNWPAKTCVAFFLAVGVCLGGAAAAVPQRGVGQAAGGRTPAQQRAERQARRQARQQKRAQTGAIHSSGETPPQPGASSGPNARAGTPRPVPGGPPAGAPLASTPPAPSIQPGASSGTNARAGTPRPAANGAPAQQQSNLPADWENRLRQMPPEDRERFLQNNQKFQSLPPDQRAQIRQHFAEYDRLSPGQKEKANQTADALARLTPAQRQNLRTQVLPQWRQMAPERRQEIKQRLNSLNGLSDAERNQKLNDPNLYQGLSPQEHDLLKQFGEYKLNPGAGGM